MTWEKYQRDNQLSYIQPKRSLPRSDLCTFIRNITIQTKRWQSPLISSLVAIDRNSRNAISFTTVLLPFFVFVQLGKKDLIFLQ